MSIKESIERTKKEFERSFAEKDYYNHQTQDEKHLELILEQLDIQKGHTVLDLGTGSGYLAFPIAQINPECKVIGLDIVENTLRQDAAKAQELKLTNLRFKVYDGLKLPFEDESIDTIVTRYAVHHFPDIELALKEMARVLKTGGQLFISDPSPNDNDTSSFIDAYMRMKPDGHIRFYTQAELTDLAEHAGFRLDHLVKTEIRFPRKEAGTYRSLINQTDKQIIDGYQIQIINDEIYITEQVLNLSFIKS